MDDFFIPFRLGLDLESVMQAAPRARGQVWTYNQFARRMRGTGWCCALSHLKGAVYKQSGKKNVDIRKFFPHKEEMATLGELKHVVRRELKLSHQFVPDPALSKLVAYLASPLHALASLNNSPRGGARSPGDASPSSPRGGSSDDAVSPVNNNANQTTSSSSSSFAVGSGPRGAQAQMGSNTLAQIRANPVIGEMLNLPLLPTELPSVTNNAISNSTSFPVLELHKFVQHGAPNVSEKAEVQRVMERKKAERCVRKFQVAVHEKLMESYEPGCISNLVDPESHAALTDHAVYVRHQFSSLLRQFAGDGKVAMSLHMLKKFLRDKLHFKNWDFGEADCTTLWFAMYRFPDLNLLEQCRMSSEMERTAANFAVTGGQISLLDRKSPEAMHATVAGGKDAGPKLSPRQRKIQKFLYPSTDSGFQFHLRDLVSLLDLPKKSGLSIEFPDFRMPNVSEVNTFHLGDPTAPEKLQDKYTIDFHIDILIDYCYSLHLLVTLLVLFFRYWLGACARGGLSCVSMLFDGWRFTTSPSCARAC
ncbi:unnamed protein product [Amoebophrya sp. A120]|nr:unnamed protein product [Amoebophrya sp. A120]|eukprot:GSA120T00021576001.1